MDLEGANKQLWFHAQHAQLVLWGRRRWMVSLCLPTATPVKNVVDWVLNSFGRKSSGATLVGVHARESVARDGGTHSVMNRVELHHSITWRTYSPPQLLCLCGTLLHHSAIHSLSFSRSRSLCLSRSRSLSRLRSLRGDRLRLFLSLSRDRR